MSHFGDPSFNTHLTIGLVWSKIAILIATSPILPYDPRDYALVIDRIYNNLESNYGSVLKAENISLSKKQHICI